jgi:hypothetical protein
MGPIFRVLRPGFLVVALTALLTGSAFAQQGQINGVVSDSSGGVIPGATVTATETGTGFAQSTVSGANGRYSFPSPTDTPSAQSWSDSNVPPKASCWRPIRA